MRVTTAISRCITSGAGTGFAPTASGTVASAACTILWFILQSSSLALSLPEMMLLILAVSALGIAATHVLINDSEWLGHHVDNNGKAHIDPKEVVIDEWAGMLIALSVASPDLLQALAAFLLFRAFDIIKCGPIGWAERLPGAWGIMLDDIVAGCAAAGVLWGLRFAFL